MQRVPSRSEDVGSLALTTFDGATRAVSGAGKQRELAELCIGEVKKSVMEGTRDGVEACVAQVCVLLESDVSSSELRQHIITMAVFDDAHWNHIRASLPVAVQAPVFVNGVFWPANMPCCAGV